MIGMPTDLQTPPLDSSRSALDFIHRLFIIPPEEQADLSGLLEELSTAFAATGAGLATFPDGVPLGIHPPPMEDRPSIVDELKHLLSYQSSPGKPQPSSGAATVPRRGGGSCLVALAGTPERGGWLLWLEDDSRTAWSTSESSLLVLVGQALTQRLTQDEGAAAWAVQLDRGIRRQQLEAAARVVRRLAHDFGNILTGILGFSELALMEKEASRSPLHDYLSEVHRGAQSGAQFTSQLRLFARRQANSNRSCHLAPLLAKLSSEFQLLGSKSKSYNGELRTPSEVQLKLHVFNDLPPVALEADALRQVLTIALENAREAIVGAGVVEVSAQTVQVSAGQASALFGDVQPGKHLEIRIADTGAGLTPEAQRQLFTEPFFSTKSRKRGLGLAMAYGILSASRGGLEFLIRPGGGTIVRLLVPVSPDASPSF